MSTSGLVCITAMACLLNKRCFAHVLHEVLELSHDIVGRGPEYLGVAGCGATGRLERMPD